MAANVSLAGQYRVKGGYKVTIRLQTDQLSNPPDEFMVFVSNEEIAVSTAPNDANSPYNIAVTRFDAFVAELAESADKLRRC